MNPTDPFFSETKLFTLGAIYRTTATKRWSIVQVSREQNIAEHMYLVAMTARRYAILVGANASLVRDCVAWALIHDLPEVILGDVPTPTKSIINSRTGFDVFEETTNDLDWVFSEICKNIHGESTMQAVFIRSLVKLADLTEAIRYLQYHGIGGHAKRVQLKLTQRFNNLLAQVAVIDSLSSFLWGMVGPEFDELMVTSEFLTDHGDEYPI